MNSTAIEKVLVQGDLSQLSESDRITYYTRVCESLGLNPLTRPFDYIRLNNKLTLYAKREATEQLRRIHSVSVQIVSRELVEDVYVVTARATMPEGRCDESIGAVYLGNLQGEAKAVAMMKAETKSKRRVTLSQSGLAVLDETEVESISEREPAQNDRAGNVDLATPTSNPNTRLGHFEEVFCCPDATKQQVSQLPPATPSVWRTWRSPTDALGWSATILPDLSPAELQKLFDSVPAVNGKKAPAFVQKVLEIAATF